MNKCCQEVNVYGLLVTIAHTTNLNTVCFICLDFPVVKRQLIFRQMSTLRLNKNIIIQ